MVSYTYNLSTWEALEAGGSGIQVQPGLYKTLLQRKQDNN